MHLAPLLSLSALSTLWDMTHLRLPNQARGCASGRLVSAAAAQGELVWGEAIDLIFAWVMAEGLLALVSRQVGEFPLEALAGPASEFCHLRVHFR